MAQKMSDNFLYHLLFNIKTLDSIANVRLIAFRVKIPIIQSIGSLEGRPVFLGYCKGVLFTFLITSKFLYISKKGSL